MTTLFNSSRFPYTPTNLHILHFTFPFNSITFNHTPIIMGILPLRTPRHAEFLHTKVAGIAVPEALRQRMYSATDPVAEGAANAREIMTAARHRFAGACIMPPFDHYEVMNAILGTDC